MAGWEDINKDTEVKKIPYTISFVLLLFLLPSLTHATVYGWKGEDEVMYFSNSAEDVPEAYREKARTFTSKLAEQEKKALEAKPLVAPPVGPMPAESAYTRGFEKGLAMASEQTRLAGELARTILESVPRQAPPRIIVRLPKVVVTHSPYSYARRSNARRPYSGYGYISPYAPYAPYSSFGYSYGFRRGRFLPHSHFFPHTRTRRSGYFFPHGHASHRGFLFGHGFVVK